MGRRIRNTSPTGLMPAAVIFMLAVVVFILGNIADVKVILPAIIFIFLIAVTLLRFAGMSSYYKPGGLPHGDHQLIEKLRGLDWFQFEQTVAMAYQRAGFEVERRGGANPDGGIDLVLKSATSQRIAVQCKQWQTSKVRVNTVREFIGAMKIEGIEKGILVTLKGGTPDASQTAERNGIELLDETGLERLLESSGCQSDQEFLQVSDSTKKSCPKCKSDMVLRTAKKGSKAGSQFWGCSTYPRCNFTMDAPQVKSHRG